MQTTIKSMKSSNIKITHSSLEPEIQQSKEATPIKIPDNKLHSSLRKINQ